jgi:predicted outer membrane lipoprotein
MAAVVRVRAKTHLGGDGTNEAISMAAVVLNALVLEHVSVEMKNYDVIVMATVVQNKSALSALEHVSLMMKSNEVIVMSAVVWNAFSLEHGSAEMKKQ